MSKFKIGLLFHPQLDIGGVETHILSLLRVSDKTLYTWVVIAPTSLHFKAQVEALGGQVIDWQLRNPLLDLANLLRLIRILQDEGVDLLHIHSPRAFLVGRMAALFSHLPCVVTVHLDFDDLYRLGTSFPAEIRRCLALWLERVLNHILPPRVTKVIFVSAHTYQIALKHRQILPSQAVVIPNGITLSKFQSTKQHLSIRQQQETAQADVVLCYVGRLHTKKGIEILLQALKKIKTEITWRLWIVGDGELRSSLENLAAELGIVERLSFFGFREDVESFLQAADIFVLPSFYEGFGMAVLEAMAAGLPCVATPVGEIASLIEDGVNGFLVPLGDAPALATALTSLIEDPLLRQQMGQASSRRAANFSEDEMVARLLQVYKIA